MAPNAWHEFWRAHKDWIKDNPPAGNHRRPMNIAQARWKKLSEQQQAQYRDAAATKATPIGPPPGEPGYKSPTHPDSDEEPDQEPDQEQGEQQDEQQDEQQGQSQAQQQQQHPAPPAIDPKVTGPDVFVPMEAASGRRTDMWYRDRMLGHRERLEEEGIAGNWVAIKILGSGGFGRVALWVDEDSNGNIQDWMAVKEVYPDPALWRDPMTWKTEDVPMEIAIHSQLSGNPDSFITDLRGSAVYKNEKRFRLYQDYAPYGDLLSFRKEMNKKKIYKLPEPFVWSVFIALTSACLVMEQGHLASQEPPNNWTPIVHRDFKLSNILLGIEADSEDVSETWFRCYPQPLVCDFGIAVEAPRPAPTPDYKNGQFENPWDYLDMGTPDHMAPEQKRYLPQHPFTEDDSRLGSHTNVYGIGVCMYRLIDRKAVPYARVNGRRGAIALHHGGVQDDVTQLPGLQNTGYNDRLVDLIQRCLHFHPSERISLHNLHQEVGSSIQELRMEPQRWDHPPPFHWRSADFTWKLHHPQHPYPAGHPVPPEFAQFRESE